MANPNDKNLHELLCSTLMLLGLDAAALEHSLRTPVNTKMFLQMNKKLGETLLHFLFMNIDCERAAKVFRDCWPIVERKQEMLFHKGTFEWYKSLQQSYSQPVPSVVAKTFMAPGGPKFNSTVATLCRIALHSSIAKRAPCCTLLNFPAVSRCPEKNKETLQLLLAFKHTHYKTYVEKQNHHQNVLRSFQMKSREAVSRYRRLCSDSEKARQHLQEICHRNTSLTQQQKDKFIINMPLSQMQEEILETVASMNSSVEKLWKRTEEFQEIEEASWNILSPLLSGTTHSYLDGAQYSPQVPDIIYKDHAATVNKLKLQGGVYTGEKLNLVNLLHYSNLALTSLYRTVTSTHSKPRKDSTIEVAVQQGQVVSLGETAAELSDRLAVLLPSLHQSVTTNCLYSLPEHPSIQSLELDGKPHLCPPTPPFSLTNTPVASGKGTKKNHQFALHLTPGMLLPKLGVTKDKDYILNLSNLGCVRLNEDNASQPMCGLTEPQCVAPQLSSWGKAEEGEGNMGLGEDVLSADIHGRYQQQKEKEREELYNNSHPLPYTHKKAPKTPGPLRKPIARLRPAVEKTEPRTAVEEQEKDAPVMTERKIAYPISDENLNETLLEQLADMMAQDEDDDSGAAELLTTQVWNEGSREASTVDSGCMEMTAEDTLIETGELMNITPKQPTTRQLGSASSHPAAPWKSVTPHNSPLLCLDKGNRSNSVARPQFARLIDATPCGPITYENTSASPTITDLEKVKMPNVCESPLALSKEDQDQNTPQDYKSRIAFLTQTPTKNASPISSQIENIFSRLGNDKECDAKSKVSFLFDQIKQLRSHQPLQVQRSFKNDSKPNFLSYVEDLKSGGDHLKPVGDHGKKADVIGGDNEDDATISRRNNTGENYDNRSKNSTNKWLSLVQGDEDDNDNDDTLTSIIVKKLKEPVIEEEKFVSDPQKVSELLARTDENKRSSLLPEESVFDTLTDSILLGETALELLHQDEVKSEVRRESIASRLSVASLGRLSLGSGKHLQDTLSVFQSNLDEFSGILDESDSCLFSTSMEDF